MARLLAQERVPGMLPTTLQEWLCCDDAYDAQMALRDDLIATRRDAVIAMLPEARAAVKDCFNLLIPLIAAQPGFAISGSRIQRPDGTVVARDLNDPLGTLGRLVQEDLCILIPGAAGTAGRVLGAAVLCFPSNWMLAEKLGRGVEAIHSPVPEYTADLSKRVNRLLDAVAVDRPLWRVNGMPTGTPELFLPKSERIPHPTRPKQPKYFRSERQTLVRLPNTKAVVFSIHTTLVAHETYCAARGPDGISG